MRWGYVCVLIIVGFGVWTVYERDQIREREILEIRQIRDVIGDVPRGQELQALLQQIQDAAVTHPSAQQTAFLQETCTKMESIRQNLWALRLRTTKLVYELGSMNADLKSVKNNCDRMKKGDVSGAMGVQTGITEFSDSVTKLKVYAENKFQ